MTTIAILDTGAGFLQWIGEAQSIAAAVRSLHEESVDWHADDAPDDEDSLEIYEVSIGEAAEIQAWADSGYKSGEFPKIKDEGTTYTVGQVKTMLAQ